MKWESTCFCICWENHHIWTFPNLAKSCFTVYWGRAASKMLLIWYIDTAQRVSRVKWPVWGSSASENQLALKKDCTCLNCTLYHGPCMFFLYFAQPSKINWRSKRLECRCLDCTMYAPPTLYSVPCMFFLYLLACTSLDLQKSIGAQKD